MKTAILILNYYDGTQVAILDVLRWLGFEIKEIPVNGSAMPNLPYLLVGEKEYHGMREIGKFVREEREKNGREESRLVSPAEASFDEAKAGR